jgi:hypothetical protein
MTKNQFAKVLTHSIHRKKAVFAAKQREYARHDNVFHNFERAAAIQGVTREQALIGMATKHLVSILDMVDGSAQGKTYPKTVIDQKLGDMDVYLNILEGMLLEGKA